MPLQATSGAASYDAFGGGVAAVPNYIEDVFSTYLYTGNGSTQTINNGIDLAGKGGLVWAKDRPTFDYHNLIDTVRGGSNRLMSQATDAQFNVGSQGLTFNSTGYTTGGISNNDGTTYASWTFRKQPKFFDVVTYTGNGVAGRTVAHNLGSVPGCIIVKSTSNATMWPVYHRSLGATKYLGLNTTDAQATNSAWWNNTEPTATEFTVGTTQSTNQSGLTYVAYLFAHNAGGFGLTGTDNVISCGSFTTDGSGNGTLQNLGYEPQWVMIKAATGAAEDWVINDSMRGMRANPAGSAQALFPNLSSAESNYGLGVNISSNGFTGFGSASRTYIYIAIRRGPMKVPTSGTSVFSANTSSAATGTAITTGFPVDMQIGKYRAGTSSWSVVDRLRGVSTTSTEAGLSLATNSTAAEGTASGGDSNNWGSTGFSMPSNLGGISDIFLNFRRAPGFFDEVCYSGNLTARTINHNLSAVPELMIVKARTGIARDWAVYTAATTATNFMYLNATDASGASSTMWNDTTPTASVFTVGTNIRTNNSGQDYVAYLFASCPGVSKCFSFTGNGTTQTINCGFTGGARFVLLKASSATGGWYAYDTARGMTTLIDPYLFLNSTAAEVATLGSVTTVTTGFAVNEAITTGVNTNGVTYVGIAIA